MKRLISIWAAMMVALVSFGQGQLRTVSPEDSGMDGAKLSQVDRVIAEAIADKTIPGAVVSVVRGDKIVYLPTPLKKSDLFSTLELMLEGVTRSRKKAKEKAKREGRSDEDKKIINQAKEILMDRHHMTEPEAHRYLQKCAMDSGTNLRETAEMVISLSAI